MTRATETRIKHEDRLSEEEEDISRNNKCTQQKWGKHRIELTKKECTTNQATKMRRDK